MATESTRIHISLNVHSVKKSIAFYSSLFGQQASKEKEGYANFRLDEPPIHLALQQGKKIGHAGISHVGVELPDHDRLSAWQYRLDEEGIDYAPENEARCCYAEADKLWLTDPDGYRWEVWVRTGDIESKGATRPGVLEQACACA